nr:MAG TPA: repressor domain protein [Caudoviricetes sp.]
MVIISQKGNRMNELQIFNSEEFGDIRTVTIDNEPWFVGKDVAEALGYSNASKAVSTHVGEEDRILKVLEADSQNGNVVKTQTALINESGLYALIFGSKLESAKRFKHWVTSEVLPAIRKTGSYQKPMSPVEMMRIQLGMIDDHEGRIADLEQNMTIDYGQQMSLGDIVNRVVVDSLGGKDSNAYHEIGRKVFAECNRDLKHYFNINARNNVPKKKFDEAVDYVKNWQPCTNTRIMIQDCNAQLSM